MKTGIVALLGTAAVASSAAAQTYTYAGPSVAIPDNNTTGTSVTLNVPSDGNDTITDVNVGLLIQHTWQGDLVVSLTSPGGSTVSLLHRAGDSTSTGFGFSADNFGNPATGGLFVLDDEAAAAYDSAAPNGVGATADPGVANVTGSWIPFGQNGAGFAGLSAFDGESKAGDWTLSISDRAGGDTGSLIGFQLEITAIPAPASMGLLAVAGLAGVRRRR